MKKLIKFIRDFGVNCRMLLPAKFKYVVTTDIPELIDNRTIFIVQEGKTPETIVFRCPCACNAVIYLNLLKDADPNWKYILSKNRVTIYPSVWRTKGCKSHFFIRKGNVLWVN